MASKTPKKPVRSSQVPATSAMLYEMEERLNHRMDSGFHKVDMKFEDLKSELKSEIGGVKSEIGGIKSEIGGMKAELHRVALLVEEQNVRNKFVMDGYAQIYELLTNR